MNLDKAEEAYMNDPQFRTLVKALEKLIVELEMTPSEIRSAAMFACLLIERRKPYTSLALSTEEYKHFVLGNFEPTKDVQKVHGP
ncbi:hypothetical protein LCGC14_0613000 [marine sediment metagenome]|uniref:Uncharacterized protein n=1 Tax=marine sediment metagenome TaxID=412755 RepID=A0A0F9UFL5_9ZZZZ